MPDPYYADDLVTLYAGDCLEILPSLPRQSVDVVLTDPPFFMPATHYSSRINWQRSWADTSILSSFWADVLTKTVPLLRLTGHLLTFCSGDSYPVFYPETYRRFDALKSLVWDKGRIGMGTPWRNQHELILAARWQGAWSSPQDKGCPDVLRHAPVPSDLRVHPVDKPVGLLMEVLQPVCPSRGLVLDPFMGGGSTLLAAKRSGRRAIGIEMEERYCEMAARRLAQDAFDFGGIA